MAVAKLINSSAGQKENEIGKWHVHDQIKTFIQGIDTGKIDLSQASSTLISSVPTPWARPKLFWFAFDYLQSQSSHIKTSGLIEFYHKLVEEWKGLIALIALYPEYISFSDPLYMDPLSKNTFEMSGAFGRMLMEDSDLWTNQEGLITNPNEKPFIQLVKYKDHVIGGTSPFTIVFSGVDYRDDKLFSGIGWYSEGKFKDPTKSDSKTVYLDSDKLQKLYLFIKNLNDNFEQFGNNININRKKNLLDKTVLTDKKSLLDLRGVSNFLTKWKKEIEDNWQKEIGDRENGKGLESVGPVAKYGNLRMPFKALLTSDNHVYQRLNRTLTFHKPDNTDIKAEIDDLQILLKEDKGILGWNESADHNNYLSKASVYYLRVIDESVQNVNSKVKYFPLPLSIYGIRMFNKDLGSLLDQRNPNFNISGRIVGQKKLIVDLTIEIDGRPQKLNSKEYEIEWATQNKKVIMWPDFISDNWDAYYLYSEFPSNVQGLKFIPFFKECQKKDENETLIDTQSFVTISREHVNTTIENIVYSTSKKEDIEDSGMLITNLITYPVRVVNSAMHKYEIIKSNKPFAGLEIRDESSGHTHILGYLVIKNPNDPTMGKRAIVDLTKINITNEAIVGIDFGSSNTCVHYKTKNASVAPILFKNRRLALVGIDSHNSGIAEIDELLFFSNEPTINGQIKSWLHEHEWNYVRENAIKEIAGGVPVNEKNILVLKMTDLIIETQAGILNYNMKWLSEESGLSKKIAYLKGIWLSICADLYADHCIPAGLRWSFPGSMSSSDYTQYRTIYNTYLPETTPILNSQAYPKVPIEPLKIVDQTEAEAVCKFALSQNYGLSNSNLFLGIDVGGSTSDILILAQDIDNGNDAKLFKQSSVRIAAGVFFDAITNSSSFRKAIFNYHEHQKQTKRINVENIKEIQTAGHKAPFYLNSVFDQLTDTDFHKFYTFIGNHAPFVFSLPAYVTGLLLFYSGKLTGKTIRDNKLSSVREIHLLPYGKGGRLFHWLKAYPGGAKTDKYFENCFFAGFGENAESYSFIYRNLLADNKSEVSKGLLAENKLIYDSKVRFESDIFGEKNIEYLKDGQYIVLNEDAIISNEYFEYANRFKFPLEFENFEKFLKIFLSYISEETGLVDNIDALIKGSRDLRNFLPSFITNDKQYEKAQKEKEKTQRFEYRFPIFIAEGLCYLNEVLIPNVFKQ